MTDSIPLLQVKNLTKTYPTADRNKSWRNPLAPQPRFTALDQFSFTMQKGQVLGLIGESGCGKTTAAKIIARLLKADTGEAYLNGEEILHRSDRSFRPLRRQIQMIFQDPQHVLNPSLTIEQILSEPLLGFGLGGDRRGRADYIRQRLDLVGLDTSYLPRYPHQLSGGQRQRVAILSALLVEPALLIADEVVSALDLSIQAQILNLLQELRQRLELSLLFISHDLHVISWLSDRILVMYKGRLVEEASTEQLLTHPLHPYSLALFTAAQAQLDHLKVQPAAPPQQPSQPRPLFRQPSQPQIYTAAAMAAGKAEEKKITPCAYAALCPNARAECQKAAPALRELADGRRLACHHPLN